MAATFITSSAKSRLDTTPLCNKNRECQVFDLITNHSAFNLSLKLGAHIMAVFANLKRIGIILHLLQVNQFV